MIQVDPMGTCSQCGGPVGRPRIWNGVGMPPIMCGHFGAIARSPYGPVIEMDRCRPLASTVKANEPTQRKDQP